MLADWASGRAVKTQLVSVDEPGHYAKVVKQRCVTVALWAYREESHLTAVCLSLAAVRALPEPPLCVCVMAPECATHAAILIEAGAHWVVAELAEFQAALPRLLTSVKLSNRGYHPLTSGLTERLPWA